MTKAGVVTVAGKPNAGKSTLLNRIMGQKLAITSPKPQSTRDRVVGIHATPDMQMIIFDFVTACLPGRFPTSRPPRWVRRVRQHHRIHTRCDIEDSHIAQSCNAIERRICEPATVGRPRQPAEPGTGGPLHNADPLRPRIQQLDVAAPTIPVAFNCERGDLFVIG
jgi:GTPase